MSVFLRRQAKPGDFPPVAQMDAHLLHERKYLSRKEFARLHGASAAGLKKILAWRNTACEVVNEDRASIGLDRPAPGERAWSPQIDFFSEYPIIPTRPSDTQRLINAANAIIEKFQQIDTKGISDQVVLTTKAMQNFLQGKEMTGILVKLHGTAGNLDKFTGRLNETVSAKSWTIFWWGPGIPSRKSMDSWPVTPGQCPL